MSYLLTGKLLVTDLEQQEHFPTFISLFFLECYLSFLACFQFSILKGIFLYLNPTVFWKHHGCKETLLIFCEHPLEVSFMCCLVCCCFFIIKIELNCYFFTN